MDEVSYLFFLNSVKNLGSWRIRNILDKFRVPEKFLSAGPDELMSVEGIDAALCSNLLSARKNLEEFRTNYDRLLDRLAVRRIKFCSIFDDSYPANLRTVSSSPTILYYKGQLSELDRYSLSIVGTRVPTEYGRQTCETLAREISSMKIPIVSGFARGIDTVAHKTALKCGNLTYAVFGCGADIIYPSENRMLYNEIVNKGAVLSEFPPGAKPDKMNFPRRNRIISALSVGTIVIESSLTGGAVLTAEYAVEQNREVFAVPGFIHSRQSEGTNELIKKGHAKLVTGVSDILCEIERKISPLLSGQQSLQLEAPVHDLNGDERKLLEALNRDPQHIDSICERTGKPVQECLVLLLSLEFRELVRQLPGKYFRRN